MLVASSNPCPCGYFGDPKHECKCSTKKILNYQSKLSGPILDRIDLHINVIPIDKSKLSHSGSGGEGECSSLVKSRVLKARDIQKKRFKNENIVINSEMSNRQIRKY